MRVVVITDPRQAGKSTLARMHPTLWTDVYASVPLHRDSLGNVFIDMELGGRKLEAMLVMGWEITRLTQAAAKRLYRFDTAPDGSNDQLVSMQMTARGLTVSNVRVSLEPAGAGALTT